MKSINNEYLKLYNNKIVKYFMLWVIGSNEIFILRFPSVITCYISRCLASGEGIVMLGVCLCVRQAATACSISLGGEGNVLYPVLSSSFTILFIQTLALRKSFTYLLYLLNTCSRVRRLSNNFRCSLT